MFSTLLLIGLVIGIIIYSVHTCMEEVNLIQKEAFSCYVCGLSY